MNKPSSIIEMLQPMRDIFEDPQCERGGRYVDNMVLVPRYRTGSAKKRLFDSARKSRKRAYIFLPPQAS